MLNSNIIFDTKDDELNNVFGIENCKDTLLSYKNYIEKSSCSKIANLNAIIRNDSNYFSETNQRLINYLYELLKKNNKANSYMYITESQLERYEECEEKIDEDLLVIDVRNLRKDAFKYNSQIVKLLNSNQDKIVYIIDYDEQTTVTCEFFSKYFDWCFYIDEISIEDKICFIQNFFRSHEIEIEDINNIEKIADKSFFDLKCYLIQKVLKCKNENIKRITNENSSIVFEDIDTKKEVQTQVESKSKENFDDIIGMSKVKNEVNKIMNYLKYCKKNGQKIPMLHMCFTGNPGTGKTTVARIVGNILKQEGILSTGNFIEINGRDLVGKYVGWTSKETQKYIEKAKGGVLFIDEAYDLNSSTRGGFEDEAIATLIKEMEDKRNDLCVILAGYSSEMESFISRNPGFESRIQFYINFENYTSDELYMIFNMMAQKEGYKITSQAKKQILECFNKSINSKYFSNGRFVRSLYEKCKIEQANRTLYLDEKRDTIIKQDVIEAIANSEKIKDSKRVIGF